jgi:hypothetical protein
MDCLTFEVQRLFTQEWKEKKRESSIVRLELLIVHVVRPYKIGMSFFLVTTLLLGWYLLFARKHETQLAAIKAENAQLHEALDNASQRLAKSLSKTTPEANAAPADLDMMASVSPNQFYNQITILAEKKQIARDELVRLIKVGASKDPVYALRRVRRKKVLRSALSSREFAELVRNGKPKEE